MVAKIVRKYKNLSGKNVQASQISNDKFVYRIYFWDPPYFFCSWIFRSEGFRSNFKGTHATIFLSVAIPVTRFAWQTGVRKNQVNSFSPLESPSEMPILKRIWFDTPFFIPTNKWRDNFFPNTIEVGNKYYRYICTVQFLLILPKFSLSYKGLSINYVRCFWRFFNPPLPPLVRSRVI